MGRAGQQATNNGIVSAGEDPPSIAARVQPHESSTRASLPVMRTLVVDDDPATRAMLLKLLQRAGHIGLSAASAEEGLALFREHQPHIVLMDVMLPGLDGVQAMQSMKRERGDAWLPVVLMSVQDAPHQILRGLRCGADGYLTKPLSIEHVVVKLRNTTRSLQLQTQLASSLHFARTVMDHIHEALICSDDQGNVQSSNRAAEAMFGYPPGSLKDLPLSRILMDEGRDSWNTRPMGGWYGTGRRQDGVVFSIEARQTRVEVEGQTLRLITLRDVTQRLEDERRTLNDAARLREYKHEREAENALARDVLERLQRRALQDTTSVRYVSESANGFSGDVVTALRSPGGKLYVVLADATGHGLAAAISLVPSLSIIHAMVARDCPLSKIVAELNDKTQELLPVGRFLAAALVCLDETRRSGEIWVGGVPAVTMIDAEGEIAGVFNSEHFPLGIVATTEDTTRTVSFTWDRGSQLILTSDGVIESEDIYGEQFGERRLLDALRSSAAGERLSAVHAALCGHLKGLPFGDDASLAVIDLR